jgi:hypothetical protein
MDGNRGLVVRVSGLPPAPNHAAPVMDAPFRFRSRGGGAHVLARGPADQRAGAGQIFQSDAIYLITKWKIAARRFHLLSF